MDGDSKGAEVTVHMLLCDDQGLRDGLQSPRVKGRDRVCSGASARPSQPKSKKCLTLEEERPTDSHSQRGPE